MKRAFPPEVEAIKKQCIENINRKRIHTPDTGVKECKDKRIRMSTYEDGLQDGKRAWAEYFKTHSLMCTLVAVDEISKAFENVRDYYEREFENYKKTRETTTWVM